MYFTDNNVQVTDRIEKGKTLLVFGTDRESKVEAEKIAKQKRSYVYDVFEDNKTTGKRTQVGFGIPN